MLAPDTRLRRDALAQALTAAGYPITKATLAKMACVGGGPPYNKFGRYPVYTWGDVLGWAKARCVPRGEREAETALAQQP